MMKSFLIAILFVIGTFVCATSAVPSRSAIQQDYPTKVKNLLRLVDPAARSQLDDTDDDDGEMEALLQELSDDITEEQDDDDDDDDDDDSARMQLIELINRAAKSQDYAKAQFIKRLFRGVVGFFKRLFG